MSFMGPHTEESKQRISEGMRAMLRKRMTDDQIAVLKAIWTAPRDDIDRRIEAALDRALVRLGLDSHA